MGNEMNMCSDPGLSRPSFLKMWNRPAARGVRAGTLDEGHTMDENGRTT